MQSFVMVEKTFHGSHSLPDHFLCGGACGHTWTVRVTVTGDEDADRYGAVVEEDELLRAMEHATWVELNGRDISTMVRPSHASPTGLAHWFYERLASKYEVTEVEVWLDNGLGARISAP
jgi:6-pyruvoyl-tetrahydropterin synthase